MKIVLRTQGTILLVSSLVLAACQHSQAARDQSGLDAALEEDKLESQDNVQMELWSPARRKANASFYFLTGEYEAMNRNGSKARRHYENAYNLDPNPFLAVKLLEAKAAEDIENAVKMAQKMILLYPEYADLQLLYGRLLTASGSIEKAEEHLRLAVKLDPENLESYVFLIHLYQTQQKYKKAIEMANQVVKINSAFAEGWAKLSRLYLIDKQLKAALEPARRAFDLSPMDAEKALLYAWALDLNGEKVKAATYYDMIVKLDSSTSDELLVRMVGLYKETGTLEEALQRLGETEKVSARESSGVRLQMAFIYWEQREFVKASALLDGLAASQPQSERLSFMSALGQERTQKFDKALETYKSFDSSSEFYVSARYRAFDILRQQGQIDEALQITQDVIASQIDRSVDFYPLAAQLLGTQKNYRQAIELLDRGFKKFPERFDLLFLKAVNLERLKEFTECERTIKQLLTLDPQHAAAHNYLGYMYVERRENLDEAEFHIKKALEIKPDDGYYLDSLGWLYFQRAQYDKALEYLLRANEQVANEGVILEHIADTYVALGQRVKAREYYEKAMQTKMEDIDKQRVKDKFEKNNADE